MMDGNPSYTLIVLLVPAIYALSAGMLNLSCRICSVETPGFWRALLVVVASTVASTGLIYVLGIQDDAYWGLQALLGLLVSCGLVCWMLRTTPIDAFRVVLLECVMTVGIVIFFAGALVVVQRELTTHRPQANQQPYPEVSSRPAPPTFLGDPPRSQPSDCHERSRPYDVW
jgi:hypothetical protein